MEKIKSNDGRPVREKGVRLAGQVQGQKQGPIFGHYRKTF